MSAGTSAVELCGGWDGACANPTPVYLGDNVGCFLNCDASDCCRSEICQDWNGVCADPTPEYLGDGEDCFGTCSTAKCCRSQICEDWNGVCVDPTPVYLGNNQDCAGTCNADKCCESGPLDITCSLTILGGVCGEEATIDIAAPVAAATPAGLAITPDPNVPLSNTDVAPWEEFHTYTVTDANGNTDTCRVEMSVVGNCEDPEQVCDPVKKVCEELCGTWNGACEDPTPVYLGDGVGCGGTCDESTCCRSDEPTPAPTPPPAPTPGSATGDPHMQGLRGQRINWSGVDGGWYSLVKDDDSDININLRVTAPLPDEFPDRQLITSLAVLSEGHSLVIEVENPYATDTDGCPEGVSPCLANGGLRVFVDGQKADELLRFSRQLPVADGAISVSASNLPVECRQFGGHKIWGRMYQEMLEGRRQLANRESFEDWILKSDHMPAPGWCAKYIAENDLADMQSTHAIFKIETPTVAVRLDAGVNHQGDGELHWDGRVLPDLEFWQMDVVVDGLDVENPALSGLLGETARPMYDENGKEVKTGFEAFRGTVEDYRVASALGVHFPLLDKQEKEEGQQ